jgi:hypothetical protein
MARKWTRRLHIRSRSYWRAYRRAQLPSTMPQSRLESHEDRPPSLESYEDLPGLLDEDEFSDSSEDLDHPPPTMLRIIGDHGPQFRYHASPCRYPHNRCDGSTAEVSFHMLVGVNDDGIEHLDDGMGLLPSKRKRDE